MLTLGLIACSKSKGRNPALALLLYKGALFQKSIALARCRCDDVAILSAKYGLVLLDQRIEPYELTLNTMSLTARHAWTTMVRAQLLRRFPDHALVYYTGERYCEGLPDGEKPMSGMPLGYRLQWLDRQLKGK